MAVGKYVNLKSLTVRHGKDFECMEMSFFFFIISILLYIVLLGCFVYLIMALILFLL